MTVVNLTSFRRRKLGRRPVLELVGTSSNLGDVLKLALAAADDEDRRRLFEGCVTGSYDDMIVQLVHHFEVPELTDQQVFG